MTSLADVFRQYGSQYRTKFGARILPSHRQALRDIVRCRTAALGGHRYYCAACDEHHYRYHSCRNRHCPQCQTGKAQQWLVQQQALLLPVPFFMLTFTLPEPVRKIARRNQQVIYNLLFRVSAAATQQLARDPRFVGGQIGMVGILHTWSRTLTYHPHVHYLIPAGGLAADGQTWRPGKENFFLPVKALSKIFRAQFREALQKTSLFETLPHAVWQQAWVVHCKPVGHGGHALKYLAAYVFRVALGNQRILALKNGRVTFRYKDSQTGQYKNSSLLAEEFIRRFLQHILPRGFVKVRYYGLFSPSHRAKLPALHQQLGDQSLPLAADSPADSETEGHKPPHAFRCPTCGQLMQRQERLQPDSPRPP